MRGVFVGRFNPVHRGHTAVIDVMWKMCVKCLIVIGSSTNPISIRHFFSYEQRRKFIKTVCPALVSIVGIPDYNSDRVWLTALDDILNSVFDPDNNSDEFKVIQNGFTDPPKRVHREITFFGGCEEDVEFFIKAGRKVHLLNRFDGTTPKVSATEIRDDLIYGRSLEGKLPPVIIPSVQEEFEKNWEIFKRI